MKLRFAFLYLCLFIPFALNSQSNVEIKVAFAVFPALFETDKAFIVKKINELGEAQKVKVFLDNQKNKYSNSQISIYFKINNRLYGYNFDGKNNVEFQMIPTGTRGFEQSMIYDINDFNLFWRDSLVIFDSLQIKFNWLDQTISKIKFELLDETNDKFTIQKEGNSLLKFHFINLGDSDVFYNAKASYNIGQSYKSSLLSIRIPGNNNKQRLRNFITEMNRLFPELSEEGFYNTLCSHFKEWGYINKSASDQLYNNYW